MNDLSGVESAFKAVESDLLSVRHWADASFVRLPLIYPSGTQVTVKVDHTGENNFLVSDNGFAYREIESVGAQRSFRRTAEGIAEEQNLQRDARTVYLDVPFVQLSRAISDVAIASWRIVDRIFSRLRDEDETEIVEHLTERLVEIFGPSAVRSEIVLVGASTSEWEMTASVEAAGKQIAFQAVSPHANSIFRANAAFGDLAALDRPPGLVAVVQSKAALGTKLSLLARQALIIEEGQSDRDFRRVVELAAA